MAGGPGRGRHLRSVRWLPLRSPKPIRSREHATEPDFRKLNCNSQGYRHFLISPIWYGNDTYSSHYYPGRAVEDRTSLHAPSPQNGNFLNTDQRLLAKFPNFKSNSRTPETGRRAKSPARADLSDACVTQNRETGLAGWGGAIRTAKFPFQIWPLKLRANFRFLHGIAGQRLSRDKVAETDRDTPPQTKSTPL